MSIVFETENSHLSVGRDFACGNQIFNAKQIILLTSSPSPSIQPHTQQCPAPPLGSNCRHDVLERMHKFYFPSEVPGRIEGGSNPANVLLLIGPRGCEESQLARQYVHNRLTKAHLINRENIFFVDGSSQATLESGFASIACSKGSGHQSEGAITWMAKTDQSWFLIIENANDRSVDLREYLPRSTHGRVLITTRLGEGGEQYGSGSDSCIILEGTKPREVTEDKVNPTQYSGGEGEGNAVEGFVKVCYEVMLVVQ